MKELTDYIIEKLDISNVNLNSEFPIDASFNEMIDFLKSYGFEELKSLNTGWYGVILVFNKHNKGKYYMFTTSGADSLKFADMSQGEISNNTPLYHIRKTPGKAREFLLSYKNGDMVKHISKEDFISLIYKNKVLE